MPWSGNTRQCSCRRQPGAACCLECTMVCHLVPEVSFHSLLCTLPVYSRHTCTVHIAADYPSSLDEHVVARSRYCSGTNCIGVPAVPSNLDRVGVGINEQENQDRVQGPSVDSRQVESNKTDEQRECPDLADRSCERKLVPHLGQVCQDEHRDDCCGIRYQHRLRITGRTYCVQHSMGW